MKLYSRSQIVLVVASLAVAALGLGFGLGARFSSRQSPPAIALGNSGGAGPALARTIGSPSLDPSQLRTVDLSPEYSTEERQNIDVYGRLNEAVVNITTEIVAVNWFMEPVPQDGGSGSGSIIDSRGYVLTNNHVVKGAYKLYVNLADGSRYEAKVVGTDPESDLAIIKFTPPRGVTLGTVPFGDSSNLKVGQRVLAIGNPFGLERTLTVGIVSALGRPVQEDNATILRDMIQTDASINPGNSGGPLLNTRGEMIGVNTMIYSPSGGSVGVGFAIPVATAKRIVPQLIKDGRVVRGSIEVDGVQLFPQLVDYMKQNGYPVPVEKGLLVSQAKRGGNADRAGIRGGTTAVQYGRSVFYVGGDIITAIDGASVGSLAEFYAALEDNKPGDRVTVELWRNGRKISVEVPLVEQRGAAQQSN
ncbi:MAG TPA: trypsin-like peptidase domain-containing protein [Rectinemataceae bacterium]|nr:trypsin-like peptidase domain-containing protein [Rectinemataceae bacterium]